MFPFLPDYPPSEPSHCFIIAPVLWLFKPLGTCQQVPFQSSLSLLVLPTGQSWVKERSWPLFSVSVVAVDGQMLSFPVGTKYNWSYKPEQTCNNKPWRRLSLASVNKLPKALTSLAMLQTWLIAGGGCFQDTCLLEAVFRLQNWQSNMDVAYHFPVYWDHHIGSFALSWLLRRNTHAFIRPQLPTVGRHALACKGCIHTFPLPCLCFSHCSLPGLFMCCLVVFPRQPDETCSSVPVKETRIAVGPGGGWWRQAVVCMCVCGGAGCEKVSRSERTSAFFTPEDSFSQSLPDIFQLLLSSHILQPCTSHFGEEKWNVVNFKPVQSFMRLGGGKPVIG